MATTDYKLLKRWFGTVGLSKQRQVIGYLLAMLILKDRCDDQEFFDVDLDQLMGICDYLHLNYHDIKAAVSKSPFKKDFFLVDIFTLVSIYNTKHPNRS